MTITIDPKDGTGTYILTFPLEGQEALNEYAKTIGKSNGQQVVVALLNDQLMTQNVIPRTPVPPNLQIEIDAIKATADAAIAQLNAKTVEPYKPSLTVDGTPTPLGSQGR
jgi:hypothetical protein